MPNYKSSNPTSEYIAQTKQVRDAMLQEGTLSIGDRVYVIADKKRYIVDFNNTFQEYSTSSGGGTPTLEDVTVQYNENDTYDIQPSSGYDGISSVSVTVDVPAPQPVLEDVQVNYTDNDTYNITPSQQYDGIGSVEVTVEVQPNLEDIQVEYTSNNTYTITPSSAQYDGIGSVEVTVDVPSSGSGEPTVFLYDYDGAVIASYTPSQFAALSAYPAAPVHEGLTFQSWNWPLATAKEYVANYSRCDIGATYRTTDNKTRLYIGLHSEASSLPFCFAINGEGTINWGDGTTTEISGNSLEEVQYETHNYATTGRTYTIEITNTGTISLGYGDYDPVVGQGYQGQCDLYKVEMGGNARVGSFYTDGDNDSTMQTIVISEGTEIINQNCFSGCTSLKHITLPNSVTSVLFGAFADTDCLNSISLPPNCVLDDADSLFTYSGLPSIVIPTATTVITDYMFSDCYSLTSITIPNSVTSIDGQAFQNCALTNVTIHDGVMSIGDYVFSGCNNLTSVTIPNSVTHIGDGAFDGCASLKSITLPTNYNINYGDLPNLTYTALRSISIPNGVNALPYECLSHTCLSSISVPSTVSNIGYSVFQGCVFLISAFIASSVVGDYLFEQCKLLSEVTFSDSVTSLGGSLFGSADTALHTITFLGSTPPDASSDPFSDLTTNCVIRVPQGSLSAYTSAENYPDPSTYTYIEY